MIGILREFALEDGCRLEICRIGLICLRLGRGKIERGKDLCLVVVRIALRQRLLGLGAR
jgi:hypothetical protein